MRRGRPISPEAMPISFLVVDDFLSNAEEFRESALKLNYPHREREYFPGRNSVEPLPIPGLDQVVSSIVQEPLRAVSPPGSHGKVRVALESEAGDWSKVHVDPAYWSGILYLTKDEDCLRRDRILPPCPHQQPSRTGQRGGLEEDGFRQLSGASGPDHREGQHGSVQVGTDDDDPDAVQPPRPAPALVLAHGRTRVRRLDREWPAGLPDV